MSRFKKPLIAILSSVIILAGLYGVWWTTRSANNLQQTTETSPNTKSEFTNDQFDILAVGDIATCQSKNDETVATVMETFDGRILTLGDTVYNVGSPKEFTECFNPAWKNMVARIFPTPGNHDYETSNAAGYFNYFGSVAAPPKGYYSFEYGGWLLLSLNSNCSKVPCDANSPQVRWIKEQLSSTTTVCQLAYYHHPRFSSGLKHGDNQVVDPIWKALVKGKTDVVLSGHEHLYERFAKLDLNGDPVPTGTRQFIVGTGGRSLYPFATAKSGSEVRDNQRYGFLKVSLSNTVYAWEFIDANTKKITDFGNDSCR